MKDDFDMLELEELCIADVPQADDEIITGLSVSSRNVSEMEALSEVHPDKEEEIVAIDAQEQNDWQIACKHLNARLGELEVKIAALERELEALKEKA